MTISSTNRKAGPYIGNGTATVFPFYFKVFTAADVEVVRLTVATNVETTLALTTDYTVALNTDQNANPGGSITLVAGALATGYNLVVTSDIGNLQPTDLTNQGGFYPDVINDALDRATIQIQQLQTSVDRAALLPITSDADAASLVADIVRLADSADNLDIDANNIDDINTVADNITNVNTVATNIASVNSVAGNTTNINAVNANSTNINAVNSNKTNIDTVAGNNTNITTVAGISANVTTVAGSNTAVTTVATNITAVNSAYTNLAAIIDAPTQAANAANSAAQAAASAASGMYSAVQDKSANYTIVAGDAGDLIRVTTTSGSITITLPLISGVGDGFKVAVVKWTSDSNVVNIARSGSNTINGATSAQIGSQYSQIIFVADLETGTWFASQTGLGATNVNVDVFSGNGSTTGFTLTSDPGTKNNTAVYISGVYQQKSTYTISGTTLTFSTAPPTGTANIEVAYSTPLAIGTPSDGTVTTAKIVDGNVTAAKLGSDAPAGVSDKANTSTGYMMMPVGTTAQRPGTPAIGMFRMNSTTYEPEWYDTVTSSWITFAEHSTYLVDYVVVAGGGGGGAGTASTNGAGGGAGGFLTGTGRQVLAGTGYTITVGAGGASTTNGNNSVFSSSTAIGGGSGGSPIGTAGSGGSGGGAAGGGTPGSPGSGTSGQGNNGGTGGTASAAYGGGGGGGAGAVGGNGSSTAGGGGGGGIASSYSGSSVAYAGGGGGSVTSGTVGAGVDGGGNGGGGAGTPGSAGTANRGGGGGGGVNSSAAGGAGGSGIVIIRYLGAQRGIGGTVTQLGGYTIHTFTSSGTFTA